MMSILDSGESLNTPHFSKKLAEDYVAERLKHDEEHLGDNWINHEDTICTMCNGIGKNPEFPQDPFCFNCDGNGVKFRISYGMQDGTAIAYCKEWGLEFLKDYCKAEQEAFVERQMTGKATSSFGIMPYVMPQTLQMELLARGLDPKDFLDGRNTKMIANIIAREYPVFMRVPYKNF